jgi:EmrB/QacA subfamily drug resistance transporter
MAALLDTTIVSVALDAIAQDFDASEGSLQGASTAYLLMLALVTPLVGWSVDRFGAKGMWIFSLTIFLLGSLLCATAWSITSLIVFRVVQGIGGGLILPLCQAILAQAAGPERFGRVMGLVAIPGQLAPIIGPVLGGVIIDKLDWRWIFFVNVPICLVALFLAWRKLPAPAEERRVAPLDRTGLLLLPPGLCMLTYGFSRVHDAAGFSDPSALLLLIVGAVLIIGFCLHAIRTADPLLDLRLFLSRSFSLSSALVFLHGVAIYGPLFLLPLFYARARGYDASTIGWLLAPQGLGTVLALFAAGALADRYGSRPLVLSGTTVAILGTLAFTQLSTSPSGILLSASLFVRGLGLGLVGVAITTAAYRDISAGSIARATSTISVVQRLGASFGTTAVALILAIELPDGLTQPGDPQITSAYSDTFWWTLAFSLATLIPASMLPASPRTRTTSPPKLPGPVRSAGAGPARRPNRG